MGRWCLHPRGRERNQRLWLGGIAARGHRRRGRRRSRLRSVGLGVWSEACGDPGCGANLGVGYLCSISVTKCLLRETSGLIEIRQTGLKRRGSPACGIVRVGCGSTFGCAAFRLGIDHSSSQHNMIQLPILYKTAHVHSSGLALTYTKSCVLITSELKALMSGLSAQAAVSSQEQVCYE